MTESTKDQLTGGVHDVHEMKGTVKETVGQLTNNPDLQNEGADEKLAGQVQRKIGEVEKVLGQ